MILSNRVYPGSETFVEKVQAHIDREKELSEIPALQRRPVPGSLEYYEQHNPLRNHAIIGKDIR